MIFRRAITHSKVTAHNFRIYYICIHICNHKFPFTLTNVGMCYPLTSVPFFFTIFPVFLFYFIPFIYLVCPSSQSFRSYPDLVFHFPFLPLIVTFPHSSLFLVFVLILVNHPVVLYLIFSHPLHSLLKKC